MNSGYKFDENWHINGCFRGEAEAWLKSLLVQVEEVGPLHLETCTTIHPVEQVGPMRSSGKQWKKLQACLIRRRSIDVGGGLDDDNILETIGSQVSAALAR